MFMLRVVGSVVLDLVMVVIDIIGAAFDLAVVIAMEMFNLTLASG